VADVAAGIRGHVEAAGGMVGAFAATVTFPMLPDFGAAPDGAPSSAALRVRSEPTSSSVDVRVSQTGSDGRDVTVSCIFDGAPGHATISPAALDALDLRDSASMSALPVDVTDVVVGGSRIRVLGAQRFGHGCCDVVLR
jgi:hypothetical protein